MPLVRVRIDDVRVYKATHYMTAVKLGRACAILGLPSRFHGNQTIVRLFENKFGIITSKSLTEKNNPRFRISKSYYLVSRHDMCVCV